MTQLDLPERLTASVRALGPVGQPWIDELPGVLASLEAEWSVRFGAPSDGGNSAYVVEVVTLEGALGVVKVALPAGIDGLSPCEQELETLLLAQGDPYVAVIRHDTRRGSVLMERLGPPLASLGWSTSRQIEAWSETLARG